MPGWGLINLVFPNLQSTRRPHQQILCAGSMRFDPDQQHGASSTRFTDFNTRRNLSTSSSPAGDLVLNRLGSDQSGSEVPATDVLQAQRDHTITPFTRIPLCEPLGYPGFSRCRRPPEAPTASHGNNLGRCPLEPVLQKYSVRCIFAPA